MDILEMYALRGSISYGKITPTRLKEIVLGDMPKPDERTRIFQSLVETDTMAINFNPAAELAAELGMTLEQLEARYIALTGKKLGAFSFSANLCHPFHGKSKPGFA